MKRRAVLLLIPIALGLPACVDYGPGQASGTLLGAGAGAATGAIIGNNVRGVSSGEGAVAGALIGGVLGNVIGRQQDEIQEIRRDQSYRGYSDYPLARPSRTRGYVYSPYSPHHLIDVRGIPEGAVVIDPSCDRRFINP